MAFEDPIVRNLSRRSLLRGFGIGAAGLTLGVFSRGRAEAAQRSPALPPVSEKGLHPNIFVQIAPDGQVTIVCHRSEMGQGVRSSLPALIADELGADLSRIKIAQADGDAHYGDQDTDGSSSVRKRYQELRQAGAAARTMLIAVAAKRWGVEVESCDAQESAVIHPASKRKLEFGALVEEASRLAVPEAKSLKLRREDQFKYIGTELPLVDAPDIVTGKARFGADIQLSGLLYAVIARPPVVGGKIKSYDDNRARAVPGVLHTVLIAPITKPYLFKPLGGIAVVASNTWAALKGRAALEIVWDAGENASYDSALFRETLKEAVQKPGKVQRNLGDADAQLANAKTKLESIYATPHFAHLTMEPPCATAHATKDGCEIWAPTQDPQGARSDAAKALGLPEEKVIVHVTLLGGGFGRKSKCDFVTEAALISKAMNAPVRLQWTREDDIQNDYYLTTSVQRLAAAIDDSNQVTAWHHRTAFPPIASLFNGSSSPGPGDLQQGVLDLALSIPNVRAESCDAHAHTRIGWLRSVANIYHAFAVQSFIDELSYARHIDPRDNLLELIGPPRFASLEELGVAKLPNYGSPLEQHPVDAGRLRNVIERVTANARWSSRKAEGRVLGLAAHRSFLAYIAVVISVVRDGKGTIHVDEAWSVADAGQVVNLDRVRSQMEGAVIFGMSVGIYGSITMRAGAVEQTNFHDHPLVRIAQAPRKIHIEVVESHLPPCGVGEPGVPPVIPALANAVYALTGNRLRELPLIKSAPF